MRRSYTPFDSLKSCFEQVLTIKLHFFGNEKVHDLQFPDGKAPPPETIERWMDIVTEVYTKKKGRIAVHCLAGLGRAPVLAAIALIEQGKQPMDAILMIRELRYDFEASKTFFSSI